MRHQNTLTKFSKYNLFFISGIYKEDFRSGHIASDNWINLYSLAVTLRSTWFNIKNVYIVVTLRLCVLYGSQNKQQLLPYKTLRDWFL
jgi:hypothetical protein